MQRTLSVFLGTLFLLCWSALAGAQEPAIQGLGKLQSGAQRVHGVSADGTTVVGRSGKVAFKWTEATGMVQIPGIPGRSMAVAASADGSAVAGQSLNLDTGITTSWVWTTAGGATFLEGSEVYAEGMSDDGMIVVGWLGPAFNSPFYWTQAEGVVDLDPENAFYWSAAFGISGDGSVIYGFGVDDEGQKALTWVDGEVVPLTKPGGGIAQGRVLGGNSNGQAFTGVLQEGEDEGFRWNPNEKLVDISKQVELEPGVYTTLDVAEARRVTGTGHTVIGWGRYGQSVGTPTDRGFIWNRFKGTRLLGNALEEDYGLDTGSWELLGASALSESGQVIAGRGKNSLGEEEGFVVTLPPACDDGIDNDGDGKTDITDIGCLNFSDPDETSPLHVCDNDIDDDGDGLIDVLQDPGCSLPADASEQDIGLVCDDGIDNDDDGYTDWGDPGCSDPEDESEQSSAACDDGIDNDGDELIDIADVGCEDPSQTTESPQCQDGIDNDYDTQIDFDGGASLNGGTPIAAPDPNCSSASDNNEYRESCGLLGIEPFFLLAGVGASRRFQRP